MATAVDVPAQNNNSESSQNEKQAREKAEDFLKQAKSALKDEKFDAARSFVERAREADPELSGLDKMSRDIDEAEKEAKAEAEKEKAEQAAEEREKRIEAILDTADDLNDAERFEEALAEVAKALEIDAENEDALELREDIKEDQQKAASKALEDQVEGILDRANALRKADRFEMALKQVEDALSLDPNSKKAKKLQEKITKEQVKAEEDRLEDQVEALIDQAEDAIDANRFEVARAKEAEARDVAGNLFQDDLEDLKEEIAEEESKYNREQNEEQIDSLLDRAEQQMEANRFDDATETATQVFQYDRENKDARKLIEEISEERAEYVAEQKEMVVERQLSRAEALLENNRYEEAIAAYEVALSEDRGNRDAQKGLAKARKEMQEAGVQQSDQAEQMEEDREVAQQAATRSSADSEENAEQAAEEAAAEEARARQEQARTEAEAARQRAEADAANRRAEQEAARQRAEQERRAASQNRPEQEADAQRNAAEEARQRQEAEAKRAAEAEERAREEAERRREQQAREAEQQRKALEEQRRQQSKARREEAKRAYEEGVELYNQGELARARQRWLDAKEIDPSYTEPDAYLAETEAEYNAFLANRAQKQDFERREAEAQEKMNTLIAMSTDSPLILSEFLQTLRLFSGIDFVIAGEVNAKIEAAFEDEPLNEVLDTVLTPIGLRWEREPGTDRVVVVPDLRTEVFPVLPETLATVDALREQGVISRLLYGPNGEAILQGQEVLTDPRQNVVIITDSEQNVEKFRRFLENLKGTQSTQLIFKTFQIDSRKAPEIKALLDAILSADDKAPYNPERKLILEDSTLIIKDTAENIQKVEQILQDENFLDNFYSTKLNVATFNLTPILSFEENPDLARAFADQVRQVVETLLYAQEGRSKAEAEGRRLFYDAATMQLTIVDTPDRLESVQNYVESLPQIRNRRRSKIVFLDWATAGDLAGQIQDFIGGDVEASSGDSGDEVTQSLRTEDEFEFRGGVFRILSVEENDTNDDTDDEVEIYFRSGTSDEEETIEVGRQATFEDFIVIAEDISPSSTPGEGRARLRIRYDPSAAGGGGGGTGLGGDGGQDDDDEEDGDDSDDSDADEGLQIVPVENLNALFISYTNIEDLREVEFWVDTLDIPTLQVSIEIKFVEVIQSKAKQFKSRLNFGDLTESQTLSDSVLRSRFAQDRDEFGSPFEPLVESQDAANLLKGTTVFDFIVNNGAAPISIELKMLEAQGIINVVNGPTVTVLNNISATFEIERQFGIPQPLEGATGGEDDNLTAVASLRPVDLSVTPNVTRAGNIQLNVDVEMRDFDQNLGQLTALGGGGGDGEDGAATSVIPQPNAFTNSNNFGVLRKTLETEVRIKDGGTVVLGGWRNERTDQSNSGVPILRDIPYIGKLLFNRMQSDEDKITLLIFLTGQVVRD